jgi:hypothetical protein
MAHNFRYSQLNGTIVFLAKSGIDSADGLTPNTPKASFYGAVGAITGTGNVLVGAGVYEEAITTSKGSTTYTADGFVKLRGNGSSAMSYSNTNNAFNGFTFENYAAFGFTAANFNKCILKDIGNISNTNLAVNNFTDCIFINCTFNSGSSSNFVFNRCIFINCNVYANGCTNSYFNAASIYRTKAATPSTHNYNNIMGMVYIRDTPYADLAAQKAAEPTYNVNSMNVAPKFNSVAKLDFTLQYDSPHIGAASDGVSNIGGTAYAKTSVASLSDEWKAPAAVYDGLELSGQDVVIKAGRTSGTVVSAPLKIAANPVQLTFVNFNGFALFNKNAAGGSIANNNVPDALVYPNGGGDAGATPDRLSYEMRWTDNDTMPGSDVDYLNGYATSPGAWVLFEINNGTPPLVDGAGIGNGSPLFNPAFTYPVSAVWVQIRITLTNAYV